MFNARLEMQQQKYFHQSKKQNTNGTLRNLPQKGKKCTAKEYCVDKKQQDLSIYICYITYIFLCIYIKRYRSDIYNLYVAYVRLAIFTTWCIIHILYTNISKHIIKSDRKRFFFSETLHRLFTVSKCKSVCKVLYNRKSNKLYLATRRVQFKTFSILPIIFCLFAQILLKSIFFIYNKRKIHKRKHCRTYRDMCCVKVTHTHAVESRTYRRVSSSWKFREKKENVFTLFFCCCCFGERKEEREKKKREHPKTEITRWKYKRDARYVAHVDIVIYM